MGNQTDLANQRGQQARQKDAETAVGTARADPKPPAARCRSCTPL